MIRLATCIGAGLAAASLCLATPAFATGAGAAGHSEISATNPAPVPPSVIEREHQPAASQTNAGRQANQTQSSTGMWSGLLNGGVMAGLGALAAVGSNGVLGGGAVITPGLANAALGG